MDRCLKKPDVTKLYDGHSHVLHKRHYYLSIPDKNDLRHIAASELKGISIDDDLCFDFHEQYVAPYAQEFRNLALSPDADGYRNNYQLLNGTFMAVDGNVYHGLIRSLAPANIIEVGSGNSTRLACQAIRANLAEGRNETNLVCIEPFHSDLLSGLREVSVVLDTYVQEVDLALFEGLGPGDILFLDSTHTLRPGGDVWWEICEILPRLQPGVFVHFHDISLPDPYPSSYLDRSWYWMEQYLLQAFLSFNNKYSIVWPGNYLMLRHEARMRALFEPEYSLMREAFPESIPASFWLKVT